MLDIYDGWVDGWIDCLLYGRRVNRASSPCMSPAHGLHHPPSNQTEPQALEGAGGDRHSAARASFAAALFFEARGEGTLAQTLLAAVARLDGDGDLYLYGLARSHLGRMRRRMAAQGAAARRVVKAGPLVQALSPKRLNSPYAGSGVGMVPPLSQSC